MRSKRGRRIVLAVLLVAILGLLVYVAAPMFDNSDFEITLYQVASDKLSSRLRIALLTDLHLHEYGENNLDLVNAIAEMEPDLIAMAGDMTLSDVEDYSIVISLCEQLLPIAPIYYSLGNHEYDSILFRGSQIQSALKDIGVHVLSDEAELATFGSSTIQIGGITDSPSELLKTYGRTTTALDIINENFGEFDGFRLVLMHYPEAFLNELTDFKADLALCGHAHGGQVRLPLIGALYTPDQGFLPELTEGYHEFENNAIIISRGLGDSHQLFPRINNRPELVIVDVMWY